MPFTKEQQRKYFESLGRECPFCLSRNIIKEDYNLTNYEDNIEWVKCGECNKVWNDLRKTFKRYKIPDDTGWLGYFPGISGKPYVFIGLDSKAVFVEELK